MNFKLYFESTNLTTAYHCGAKITQFSNMFLGSGENNQILGPGVYFGSTPGLAKMYCKYNQQPYLTTVTLDTTSYYDPIKGTPTLNHKFDDIAKELNLTSLRDVRNISTLQHGRGLIGAIVKTLGNKDSLSILIKHGIKGAFEEIEPNVKEYSVFDLSTVKLISSEAQF